MAIGINCCCACGTCEGYMPDGLALGGVAATGFPIMGTPSSMAGLCKWNASSRLYRDHPFEVESDFWMVGDAGEFYIPGLGDDQHVKKRFIWDSPYAPTATKLWAACVDKIKLSAGAEPTESQSHVLGYPVWGSKLRKFVWQESGATMWTPQIAKISNKDLRLLGNSGTSDIDHPNFPSWSKDRTWYIKYPLAGGVGVGIDGGGGGYGSQSIERPIFTRSSSLFSPLNGHKHFLYSEVNAEGTAHYGQADQCEYVNWWSRCGFTPVVRLGNGSRFLRSWLGYTEMNKWRQIEGMSGDTIGYTPFPFIPPSGSLPLPGGGLPSSVAWYLTWETFLEAVQGSTSMLLAILLTYRQLAQSPSDGSWMLQFEGYGSQTYLAPYGRYESVLCLEGLNDTIMFRYFDGSGGWPKEEPLSLNIDWESLV